MKLGHLARFAGPPAHSHLVFNEQGCRLQRVGSVRPDNASKVRVHGAYIPEPPLPRGTSG